MSERSVAFILAGVTVFAWMIFLGGLAEMAANTHPRSPTSTAVLNLIHGTGAGHDHT